MNIHMKHFLVINKLSPEFDGSDLLGVPLEEELVSGDFEGGFGAVGDIADHLHNDCGSTEVIGAQQE